MIPKAVAVAYLRGLLIAVEQDKLQLLEFSQVNEIIELPPQPEDGGYRRLTTTGNSTITLQVAEVKDEGTAIRYD